MKRIAVFLACLLCLAACTAPEQESESVSESIAALESESAAATEAETIPESTPETEGETTSEEKTECLTIDETEEKGDIEVDIGDLFGKETAQSETETETESESESEEVELVYEIFEARTLTASNGLVLPYRIYVPADYEEGKSYPLALFLHGAGERGDDNALQFKNVVKTLFEDKSSPVHDSIFLVPQCAEGAQWVDTPWGEGSYSIDAVPASAHHTALLELLTLVQSTYSVDADRLYVMGISMGGFGTWDMILRHPDMFAAAIPVCGGADPSKASLIAHMPIRTFHGDKDTAVPVAGTREMAEALEAANASDFVYEELPGYGHNVWDYMAERDGLMEWLFLQRRNFGS